MLLVQHPDRLLRRVARPHPVLRELHAPLRRHLAAIAAAFVGVEPDHLVVHVGCGRARAAGGVVPVGLAGRIHLFEPPVLVHDVLGIAHQGPLVVEVLAERACMGGRGDRHLLDGAHGYMPSQACHSSSTTSARAVCSDLHASKSTRQTSTSCLQAAAWLFALWRNCIRLMSHSCSLPRPKNSPAGVLLA